jgi:hypothetical protein
MRHSHRRRERRLGHLTVQEAERAPGSLLDRRTFLGGSLAFLLAPAAWVRAAERSAELEKALETSGLAYVSPLRSDGSESTCHAEIWFAWLDGSVVVTTATDRWRARAVAQGLDRARIWVGDHGRWKQIIGRNEDFRQAPKFDARAEASKDEALMERMLAEFARKYPAEIARWRDEMRRGFHDGSRQVIRYTPI